MKKKKKKIQLPPASCCPSFQKTPWNTPREFCPHFDAGTSACS
eukprot:CAMPEP_0197475512 /NCGR_PEP_ID=MMETSP1309-20131121/6960_1 /TAXON_ID=464262 /ORGANISM="Genus nov. species nov., Strain RCC998" /LENGTH=42 /DNA_ID= /DNA_START= /DNA_END= /DNA_ORIENTATION=